MWIIVHVVCEAQTSCLFARWQEEGLSFTTDICQLIEISRHWLLRNTCSPHRISLLFPTMIWSSFYDVNIWTNVFLFEYNLKWIYCKTTVGIGHCTPPWQYSTPLLYYTCGVLGFILWYYVVYTIKDALLNCTLTSCITPGWLKTAYSVGDG